MCVVFVGGCSSKRLLGLISYLLGKAMMATINQDNYDQNIFPSLVFYTTLAILAAWRQFRTITSLVWTPNPVKIKR